MPVGQGSAAALSEHARRAAGAGDWAAVDSAAGQILKLDRDNPEGWFLSGLASKARRRHSEAIEAFSRATRLDPRRYDAAIELAGIYWVQGRHREARDLLDRFESLLGNSPRYLEMAADTWTRLGLHARALPLYRQACELQPDIERFLSSRAACAIRCGEIAEARSILRHLLDLHPHHQRNHYELSRLGQARDRSHLQQMLAVLEQGQHAPERNIFLNYAIGKELEDLEEWEAAFHHYERAGDAAARVSREAGYRVEQDTAVLHRIIEVCNARWLSQGTDDGRDAHAKRTPIFVTGLPRTGTTLTERIIGSHSRVESADETFFMQIAVRRRSGVSSRDDVSPEIIEAAGRVDPTVIGQDYLAAVEYRLGTRPMFIDKYPFNFLYLGFIARSLPGARLVHLRRNPMDACFAMYKQPYFRFAFTLEDLASYYLAYDRLMRHWRAVLGDRLIEVQYERLVSDQEDQTRWLLNELGLEFEPACLEFEKNAAASATASAVQVREKMHTRSVDRWTHFADQLQPLRRALESGGIVLA